ncbi:MAG: hypothetical protein ACLR0N_08365 [Bilophila wadsworthia]
MVTLGVVSWPSGHEGIPLPPRAGPCSFLALPVHGEAAPGVFDLVQGGVGLGEQFGVGLPSRGNRLMPMLAEMT